MGGTEEGNSSQNKSLKKASAKTSTKKESLYGKERTQKEETPSAGDAAKAQAKETSVTKVADSKHSETTTNLTAGVKTARDDGSGAVEVKGEGGDVLLVQSQSTPDLPRPVEVPEEEKQDMRERLTMYFTKVGVPEKIDNIEKVLETYAGRYLALIADIEKKYSKKFPKSKAEAALKSQTKAKYAEAKVKAEEEKKKKEEEHARKVEEQRKKNELSQQKAEERKKKKDEKAAKDIKKAEKEAKKAAKLALKEAAAAATDAEADTAADADVDADADAADADADADAAADVNADADIADVVNQEGGDGEEWPEVPEFVGGGSDEESATGSASIRESTEVIEEEKKVSIFKPDDEQQAALALAHHDVLEASRVGDLEGLRSIVEDDPDTMELEDFGGCTPLILVCMRRHIDCAEYLVEKGANFFKRDQAGNLPIQYIIDPAERKRLEWAYYKTTEEGQAELKRIADREAEEDAYLASIHIPDIIDAAFRGDIETLRKHADINPDMVFLRDKMGNTPLIAASATNQKEALHFLLEAGSKIKDKHPIGYTALSFARGPKAYEELRFLAESATIEYKAHQYGKALMHIAFDHARLRAELEERRRLELKAARELAEYLAMVARTQRRMSEDFTENTILTCTDTAFIKFMVDEEARLNRITDRVEEDAVAIFTKTGDERVESVREKFRKENRLKEAAKQKQQQEAADEQERCNMANTIMTRVSAIKLKKEEEMLENAQRRVLRSHNAWVERQKEKAYERDRRLKPRKAELTARMSKSAKRAAGF